MRLLWATILALCVLGALVRAASCHEIEPSPLDLLAEGPKCPECPVCPGPWGFDAAVRIPEHAEPGDVIHLEIEPRYLIEGGKAAGMRGRLDREGRPPGRWAEIAVPVESVPEPPGMLAVGALGMAWWARRRSR